MYFESGTDQQLHVRLTEKGVDSTLSKGLAVRNDVRVHAMENSHAVARPGSRTHDLQDAVALRSPT